jgi:putative DNA primase/helicase
MITLRELARVLAGEISGDQVLAPGPGHSAKDRSLSVKPEPNAAGGFVCFSHANDDWQECRDYVLSRLGLPGRSPSRIDRPRRGNAQPAPQAEQLNGNRELALQIWRQAKNPRGTLAEAYLRGRALELPIEAANEAIRFHPACPFVAERFPAMICLVRNIRTDEMQAIQRTALSNDGPAIKRGGKTFRLTLGPIAGAAVKLDPDEEVTQGLCIGEGVETTLAGRQMGLRPVWALLGTSGVASFPVLPGVDGLHLFCERDAANERAAMACGDRWYMAGRDVIHDYPERGNDLVFRHKHLNPASAQI